MQTFLPFASFTRSAKALDNKRLGKQRVETFQVLRVLEGVSNGWGNHPMTRMWRGYSPALAAYGIAICQEWQSRGFRDSLELKIKATLLTGVEVKHMTPPELQALISARIDAGAFDDDPLGFLSLRIPTAVKELEKLELLPWWMGWGKLHRTHRANLIRKDPDFYAPQFRDIRRRDALSMGYVWPDASKRGYYTQGDAPDA